MITESQDHNPGQNELFSGFTAFGVTCARDPELLLHLRSTDGSHIDHAKGRVLLGECAPQIAAMGHCLRQNYQISVQVSGLRRGPQTISLRVRDEDGTPDPGAEREGPWPELRDRLEAVIQNTNFEGDFELAFLMKAGVSWPEGRSIRYRVNLFEELRELQITGDSGICKVIRGEGSPEQHITPIRAQATSQFAQAISELKIPPEGALSSLKAVADAKQKYHPPSVRIAALTGLSSLLTPEDVKWLTDIFVTPSHHPSGFGAPFDESVRTGIRIAVCRLARELCRESEVRMLVECRRILRPELSKVGVLLRPHPVTDQTVERVLSSQSFRFDAKYLDTQVLATLIALRHPEFPLHEQNTGSKKSG